MTDKTMNDARVEAAKASLGTSADPIYCAVLRELDARGAAGSILDFGAGTGSFSKLLYGKLNFLRVTAADIYNFLPDSSDKEIEWILCDLNQEVPADQRFDTVVAVEVIEHLENPRFVAREWFRLLKPGGVLVFSTPNNESWRSIISLIFKKHFVSFTGTNYPAHISALLRRDFERILNEVGFEDIHFSFTDHGALPKFTSGTWQRMSLGKLKGLRYSDNIVCSARKPPM